MRVEYINPFVQSAISILEQVAQLQVERGQLALRPKMFPSPDVCVILGVTGDVKGQVLYCLSQDTALKMASRMMMGLEVKDFDEVTRSAIGELGNMITGNATGILEKSGIIANISPPAVICGQNVSITSTDGPILVVPLMMEIGRFEINVSLSSGK